MSTHASQADSVVAANAAYAAEGFDPETAGAPTRHVAIVTCMDCRIDPYAAFGLSAGEAHLMRNAGGVVTDDMIRSLCLSQRYLGTREILVVQHTDCGLGKVPEADFRAEVEAETGAAPTWSLDGFDDVDASVRRSVARLRQSPYVPHDDRISGFVYDVADGRLRAVDADTG